MALFDAAVNGEALAGLGEPLSPGESTLSPHFTPAAVPHNKSQCDALQPLGPQCSWLRMTSHDSAKPGLSVCRTPGRICKTQVKRNRDKKAQFPL